VQGTADPYGSLVHVEAVRDLAAGPVELLVLGGGHSPHLEEPDRVDAAVVAFLRGLP
jgi:pimeloyl-ACP methyl ester carboxylesterase